MPDLAGLFTGDVQAPYLMSDMAADAAGLLDALGVARAHVVGVSMGGMIAQAFAIDYPDRTLSLVSVMSNTGNPAVGQPHPAALEVLLSPAPTSRDAVIEQSVQSWKVIGSPGFDFDEPLIRRQAAAAFDRAFHPDGTVRQLVAIVASPDRTPRLKTLPIPTLVIHGADDPLVDVSGGRATAEAIPDARLEIIEGMGHDLPVELFDRFADMISENATVEHA
jgi:pimeloyl-ACP methyl ester carboxylesterase